MTPREAADHLRAARLARRTVEPLTDLHPGLDEDWAYDVQRIDRDGRAADGDPAVGAKLGLTSVAKQQRMGVDRPIVGFLTRSMILGADLPQDALARWAQPRIEPEIAFTTSRAIGRGLKDNEVAAHVATVHVAAEVLDSRYTGYRFRLPDVVADNTSAAGVLLGEPVALGSAGDLTTVMCEVAEDGSVAHRATGAAILGDPLRALQLLSRHLERRGEILPVGSLVLAGALTDAVPLVAGSSYRLTVSRLGSIAVEPRTV